LTALRLAEVTCELTADGSGRCYHHTRLNQPSKGGVLGASRNSAAGVGYDFYMEAPRDSRKRRVLDNDLRGNAGYQKG
jgi:hypothetical protein